MSRTSHSTISTACAGAMLATIMAVASSSANAHEPAKDDSMSMPTTSMDSSKGGMKADAMKMDGMKMEGLSMTGDADYDFAMNMKMHHTQALEMAEAEVAKGKSPEMLKMAKDIISTQKKEIAAFDQWLATHKKPAAMTKPK